MKLSVVMPVYNSEKFLSAAIESILNQTFTNFEFIIVDDGSKDKSLEIIKTYAEKDNRIKIITQKNKGVSAALNTGIAKAEGEWIAIMHSDDIAHPRRLEKQLNFVKENSQVVVAGTYAYHINLKNQVLGISKSGPTSYEDFMYKRKSAEIVSVIHPTAFFKKEVYHKAGRYNSLFDGSEDIELFDRMAEYGTVQALPEPLLYYRIHGSSISMNRFFDMKCFTRFVRDRQKRRLRNEELIGITEYKNKYYNEKILKRFIRHIDDTSQFNYRKAGMYFGDRKLFKTIYYFFLSVVFNPVYAIKRVWNQFIKLKVFKNK
jgi:glycosyltransferase involved in cell wall biosynthesis